MEERHEDSAILDLIGTTGYIAERMDRDHSTISCWRVRGVPKPSKQALALMFPKIVPESWKPPKVRRKK